MNRQFGNQGRGRYGGGGQEKGSNANAAPASAIGEPFHNPYTFIPFPDAVERYAPTPLSIDEGPEDRDRKSGVLELTVETLSPLLTCEAQEHKAQMGHKFYRALTQGNDVIVPATGVRGTLRTLMTIISGGTLGYMDEDLWLTQGRDAQLGPSGKMPNVPDNAFLGKVKKAGNSTRDGVLELGKTDFVKADYLGQVDGKRPTDAKNKLAYNDSRGTWEVKLSGLPVNRRNKKEGLFMGNGTLIDVPKQYWADYQGRHRHSSHPELRKGDLIWLEPQELDCTEISSAKDIKSLQWSRWGRHGQKLQSALPACVVPDSMRKDGAVDMVTDLFGQVHFDSSRKDATFAGRIRPGNLVFRDCAGKTTEETLAPLSNPHPGCLAFYRDSDDLDALSTGAPLKGYKVYRNTTERGENAPWKYSVQGVYRERGELKQPPFRAVNKTVELLDQGCTGTVRISFRALADDEFALLLAALSVDWKLGGGKPLGLGHCRVTGVKLIDEDGKVSYPMKDAGEKGNLTMLKEDYDLVEHLGRRMALYRAAQMPVDKLRYPRAVTQNRNTSNRAGLFWFTRHAAVRKQGRGLETIWTKDALKSMAAGKTQIKAQNLQKLNPDNPEADRLYGYDSVELNVDTSNRNQRLVGRIEKFDPAKHAGADEKAGENLSQNRKTRIENRLGRSGEQSITKENAGNVVAQFLRQSSPEPGKAQKMLKTLESFGISEKDSNKWTARIENLKKIAGNA